MREIVRAVRGIVVAALVVATTVAGAQQPSKAETELATALAAKHIALQAGITSAAAKGTPISAKYEFEDGKLQLSVYTEKAGEFFEVVVDHKSGKVAKAEKITNAGGRPETPDDDET